MRFKTNTAIAFLTVPLIAAGCARSAKSDKVLEREVSQTEVKRTGPNGYERTEDTTTTTTVTKKNVNVVSDTTETVERPNKPDYTTHSQVDVTAAKKDITGESTFDVDVLEPSPNSELVETITITPEVPRMVFFDTDSAKLDRRDKVVLDENAEWFRENPQARVLIEGRADSRGPATHNFALAEKRAEAVRKYLVGLGVDPGQVEILTLGEWAPILPGHNRTAYLINRSVELAHVMP